MEMQPFVEPSTPMLLLTSLLLAATLLGSSFTTQCLLYFLLPTQLTSKCCQAAWLLNPMLHCNPQPALTSLKCWPPLTQLSFHDYFPTCSAPAAFWPCASSWCLWPAFSMVCSLANPIYWCSCLVCGPLSSKSYLLPWLQSSSIMLMIPSHDFFWLLFCC